jgi:hypothetical protein
VGLRGGRGREAVAANHASRRVGKPETLWRFASKGDPDVKLGRKHYPQALALRRWLP